MKSKTQRETNPFKYTDSNKRYHTFDFYLRSMFGEKVGKVSLDAGFTCPNIDGTVSRGGCIYCLRGSSGAAAGDISAQYEAGCSIMKKKWGCKKFIPYLQAHTNTYADPETLQALYKKCSELDGAVMLAVATRADCLSDGVLDVLRETSERIPVMVELGLQSIHDETARLINRGHSFSDFTEGFSKLKNIGERLKITVHLINGLPGESRQDMLESARIVGEIHPDVIKFHLLHVLKGTKLSELYLGGEYEPMELEDYVQTVCGQLEIIPADIAVGRVTGDGASDVLIAPLWSRKKTVVANEIDKELYRRNSFQGAKLF